MFTSAEVRPGVLAKASHWATNEAESPARRRSAQDLATGQAVALQSEPPTSAADLAAAGQRRHDAAPGGRRRPATCCAASCRRGSTARRRSAELLARPARRAAERAPHLGRLGGRWLAGPRFAPGGRRRPVTWRRTRPAPIFERAQKRGGKPAPKSRQGYLLSPQHQQSDINPSARFSE